MYIPYKELSKGSEIGAGTFGDVFRGTWQRATGRLDVAIKVLKERDIPPTYTENQVRERMDKRFKRELEVWQGLSHPNILEFYGHSVTSGNRRNYVFISPLRPRGNLFDHLSQNGALSAKLRVKLSLGVALGLEYLHTCPDPGPIFHGDIKPTNILLKDEFTPQLCDFGLAKVLSDKPTGYSTSGRVAGSAHFESFEMWREGICSLEGDIFSFGGTLLLIMSGKVPYHNVHPDLIGMEKLEAEVMPHPTDHLMLPDSDSLWALMRKCWAKNPTKRPSIGACIKAVSERLAQYSA